MSDKREAQEKPLIILSCSADYPRWKAYAMSKLRQRGCEWTVTGREAPTLESIRAKLIEQGFTANQLRPNILINVLMHKEERYNVGIGKAGGILSKLVADAFQPIIENQTPHEAWEILKERFQHIDVLSTSRIMFEVTSKTIADFKDVTEYTSSYQAGFDKVASLISETSPYTRESIEAYFQATMLMNIGSEYSTPVSAIQKDWKDAETTNLPETILQISRHHEFMKGSINDTVLRTTTPSQSSLHRAPKGSCTNPECVEKGLTTHYTDRCWIKNPELRSKYSLGKMRTKGSQKNLKNTIAQDPKGALPELES